MDITTLPLNQAICTLDRVLRTLLKVFFAVLCQEQADEVLAREARSSPEAFASLYDRHVQRVYRYHLARTGSIPDAQDLTSQTFLAALEGIASYNGRGSFIAWLMGIARHKTVDHFRQQNRTQSIKDESLGTFDAVEEQAEHRLQLERLCTALKRMSSEKAEALALRIFSELSAAEAGQVMHKSEAAVRMLVYRAIKDLREQFVTAELQEEL